MHPTVISAAPAYSEAGQAVVVWMVCYRMEEASKQAEQRLSKAESKASHLQQDLSQAEHRAQQVLPCPDLHCPACPALLCTAFLSLFWVTGQMSKFVKQVSLHTPDTLLFVLCIQSHASQPCCEQHQCWLAADNAATLTFHTIATCIIFT